MDVVSSVGVEEVARLFRHLNATNLSKICEIYHKDVEFSDSTIQLEGIAELYNHFENLYKKVQTYSFHVSYFQQKSSVGFLIWEVTIAHEKINNGNETSVQGCSHLEFFEGKVLYQRNYFDPRTLIFT
ncbi:nuclear transport factor 2 family protein [Vibrio sp. HN007]|uniref:nuclear transport factor 2 family protein n=1 Tax=Vibrio iocasae TaxID=3098914 RepID=UPI0035D4BEAE